MEKVFTPQPPPPCRASYSKRFEAHICMKTPPSRAHFPECLGKTHGFLPLLLLWYLFFISQVAIKNYMGPNPNGPRLGSCDRAIRYSGFFGVRSVGPVGDFLELCNNPVLFLEKVS